MLNFRYLTAASISLVIHTAVIWATPEKQAFAMPVGSQSSQVNIKFVSPSRPVAPASAPSPQPNQSETVKAESVKTKATKPKLNKLKSVKAKKPLPPKKTTAKKPVVEKKVAKTEKAVSKKQTTKPTPKTVKTEKKVIEPQAEAKPIASKSGATEKPQLITKPSFLKRPKAPRYPRIAQRKGIQGTALYEIWLNEHGKQVKQQLVTSSGTPILDEAALKAIRGWQFSPQVIDGQAIAHRVQIPVRFSLNK